jgi:hypothetical protein
MITKKISLNELRTLVKQTIKEEVGGKSSINKFVYFSQNYPNDFIEQIWGTSGNMSKHLNDKFSLYYDKHGSVGAMVGFYMNLDSENQKMLEEYIINNYKG